MGTSSSFARVITPYLPVIAHPVERVPPPAPIPEPDVGARWGVKSDFGFSLNDGAGADTGGGGGSGELEDETPVFSVDPPTVKNIVGKEVYRAFEEVSYPETRFNKFRVRAERITTCVFHCGERIRYREESLGDLRILPIWEITQVYIAFVFIYPEDDGAEVIGNGERGEMPEPPEPEPLTIAEEVRAVKEFWIATIDRAGRTSSMTIGAPQELLGPSDPEGE